MKAVHPDQRSEPLIQLRNLKMARSAHAYVRGSTVQFYEWLHSQPGRRLPNGPRSGSAAIAMPVTWAPPAT